MSAIQLWTEELAAQYPLPTPRDCYGKLYGFWSIIEPPIAPLWRGCDGFWRKGHTDDMVAMLDDINLKASPQ